MMCRVLAPQCEVLMEAGDGLEAVQLLRSRDITTFDIVMMDQIMPRMDGPTAAEEMRAMGYKGLVIGVTGNGLQSDVDFYLASGADRVLSKPIDTTAVDEILKGIPTVCTVRVSFE
eukprot:gene36872-biopygen32267